MGIRAVIKTNQLVFEAASKSGSDVYNILSTGQLNGLSIALLLSIKNVYGDTKGLDILLIDDPLQTIDDISAISLADLLTQQGMANIFLLEDDKILSKGISIALKKDEHGADEKTVHFHTGIYAQENETVIIEIE